MTSDHNEKPGERNGNAKPANKRRKVTLKDVYRDYRSALAERGGALFTSKRLADLLKENGVDDD